MRETDFTGPRWRSTTDQTSGRDRVMRRAKRPAGQEAAARRKCPGDGVNFRRHDRFLERETRQDRRQPFRQHGFSRSGRPDHQDVVTPGGSDFQRPLRLGLAANVAEIGAIDRFLDCRSRHRGLDARLPFQVQQ